MDAVVEASRQTIEQGSKSFAAAARLFEPKTRESAYLLYAWCQYCDDQVDGQILGFDGSSLDQATSRARLETLRAKTRRALAGETSEDPVFEALTRVVDQHRIPDRYPFEHLDGFAMDVDGYDYCTLDDTMRYCYHVAGVVGIMMAYIMGVRDEPTLQRAMDLGIAFQLTNIARDVMDDAQVGRVYLPSDWLDEAGVPGEGILERQNRRAVSEVVRRLLREADRYYDSARTGIAQLPFRSAWAIATAKEVYRDIGRIVLRRGESAWDERATTSLTRKLWLATKGGVETVAASTFRKGRPIQPRSGLWSNLGPFQTTSS
jgi:phytoene synthase